MVRAIFLKCAFLTVSEFYRHIAPNKQAMNSSSQAQADEVTDSFYLHKSTKMHWSIFLKFNIKNVKYPECHLQAGIHSRQKSIRNLKLFHKECWGKGLGSITPSDLLNLDTKGHLLNYCWRSPLFQIPKRSRQKITFISENFSSGSKIQLPKLVLLGFADPLWAITSSLMLLGSSLSCHLTFEL